MTTQKEKPITAEDAAALGADILTKISGMTDNPYLLIAGLKSAAASAENALGAAAMKASMMAVMSSIINR